MQTSGELCFIRMACRASRKQIQRLRYRFRLRTTNKQFTSEIFLSITFSSGRDGILKCKYHQQRKERMKNFALFHDLLHHLNVLLINVSKLLQHPQILISGTCMRRASQHVRQGESPPFLVHVFYQSSVNNRDVLAALLLLPLCPGVAHCTAPAVKPKKIFFYDLPFLASGNMQAQD